MTWHGWLSLAAAAVAIVAVVLALQNRRWLLRLHASPTPVPAAVSRRDRPQVAFVTNPTKPGAAELRDKVTLACAARYLPEPLWYETTEEDPGVGQARQAVADGAQVVIAAGGDGTVRAVAEGLTGTDVAMALLPQGTGNLLARNLLLPLNDLDAQLRIALGGNDRVVDVGRLRILAGPEPAGSDVDGPAHDHVFLVIGGVGFDAAMVADADEQLKAKVGWIAYFVAGVRHLHAARMRLEARLDGGPWHQLRLRSFLVGNCGLLPGGITLLPDAVLDDGWLDVAAIDTRAGLLGWTQLFGNVMVQRFGVRTELPASVGRIDHARARVVRVRMREPQHVQVDGDIVGQATELEATVEHRALTVRVA